MSQESTAEPEETIRRQLPPIIPAGGFLVSAACAAGLIYGHPGLQPRYAISIVGVVAFWIAVTSLRMGLLADFEGITVRFIRREHFIPWSEVQQLQRATVRGSETLVVLRRDGTRLAVPPSLLQPARPTSKRQAQAAIDLFVIRVSEIEKRSQG
jgi:hypothetical protein